MATKPTPRIPVWASTGSKTDPGASKEAAGWNVSEKPPAEWINWVDNAIGQWLEYFETYTDELAKPIAAGWVITGDTAPGVQWETGIGVTYGTTGDDVTLTLDSAVAAASSTALIITQRDYGPGFVTFGGEMTSTTVMRIGAVNAGGSVDLTTGSGYSFSYALFGN